MGIKKGISVKWVNNSRGQMVLRIEKTHGKLTLDEIEEILRYGSLPGGTALQGHYAILLNCTEATCGGNGMWGPDTKGDCVDLYEMSDSGECPICSAMLPPFQYCSSCGEPWKQPNN